MKTQKLVSKNFAMLILMISLMFTSISFSQKSKAHRFEGKFLNQISELTDQQRNDLRTIIKREFDNGVSRTEIREKVFTTLKEWGIKVPERMKNFTFGKMQRRFDNSFDKLTKVQRAELRKKMTQLWDSGSTRNEMHEAAKTLFDKWGYELPDFRKNNRFMFNQFRKRARFSDKLTVDQRKELRAASKSLWESGATTKEIRNQTKIKLEKWGIKTPKAGKFAKKFGRRHSKFANCAKRFSNKLTEEQRAELRETVAEKRKSGADRKEIREAINEKFKDWGIETPSKMKSQKYFNQFKRFGRNMDKLSNDQRKEVRTMASDMRKNNASFEEIRKAVKSKIDSFEVNSAQKN